MNTNKWIAGGAVLLSAGGAWFAFSDNMSIEEIADDLVKQDTSAKIMVNPDIFVDSLTMNYETIDTDVFIGDPEEVGVKIAENKFLIFAEKMNTAFLKKDFTEVCKMRSNCNIGTDDALLLAKKEKDYETHSFKYWSVKNEENILCYTETIKLKNDSNKNPIISTYHVEVAKKETGELEFKKPRCEKVIKLPYGDITNRDPYNTRCGENVTRILCSDEN